METARSTTFDMNVKFDTGRKLFMSAVSNPAFFNNGVTMAWVCDAGKTPCDNEALTIWVKYGGKKSINSRTRNVERGRVSMISLAMT